ncbi:alcohol oxidase [Bimuria novae-zelandiae CBS 107.79]|uniref:Alcohol oxidase n=1 Tax=Bimuria novae-zelandiae CBS 107.79 TaxID=1447943 RepID=A0A6A5V3L3_9PLEO|nr:alcohol oxidase [Bimuria novae-zelandiae CBS 107.79]
MSLLPTFGLIVALSASGLLAHPLANVGLVVRAENLSSEYDYIVVGAGPGGLTVANRLSEDKNVTVLVIEAGGFDQDEDFITIPGLAGGAVGTRYDWNISYAPDPALNGRVVPIPRGKVVGGSTKLNRMVFDRGSRSDYDGWGALGNDGWTFDTLLPYFHKTENFTPATAEIQAEYNIEVDPANQGIGGYIQTTFSPFFWPTTKNIVQATEELGIAINDQATGNALGGYYCPHNQDPETVTRSSAEEAYYESAKPRQNYHLLPGNLVTRIVTGNASDSVQVTGVEFATSKDATPQTVKVRKEVILACGALHTPQLLQVSGIGEPALLESINVSTVVDLPAVGYNLHDHINVVVVNALNTTVQTNNLTTDTTFAAQARNEYDTQRTGPYTTPTGDFLLFLPLKTFTNATQSILSQALEAGPSSSLPTDVPPEVAAGYEDQFALLNQKLEADDSAILEVIFADGAFVLALQHPYSRGSVKANSSSMFDAPVADVGFLRNNVDTAIIREGVHFARRLAGTQAISALNPFEVVPGGNVTSSADIDAFVTGSASTVFHPASSCRMAPREKGGVVDNELKVYGVTGLRIADASVMPILPASHTMTSVYAIAEMAADIIKGDCYKCVSH